VNPDPMDSAIRGIGVRYPRRLKPRIKDRMRAPFEELAALGAAVAALGYVYFMHDLDAKLVKIGFTRDMPRRLRTVQSASGRDLDLIGWIIGTTFDESRMHDRFARLRERGEWFRATPALLRDIGVILTSDVTPGVHIPRKYRRPTPLSTSEADHG